MEGRQKLDNKLARNVSLPSDKLLSKWHSQLPVKY